MVFPLARKVPFPLARSSIQWCIGSIRFRDPYTKSSMGVGRGLDIVAERVKPVSYVDFEYGPWKGLRAEAI